MRYQIGLLGLCVLGITAGSLWAQVVQPAAQQQSAVQQRAAARGSTFGEAEF